MSRRKLYLDVVKVWGMFAIILLHTLSNTMQEARPFVSALQASVVHSIHQLLYTAVPLFLLATGAGFLSGREKCSYADMKGHIIKILVCIFLFGGLFWTIECILTGGQWTVKDMILAILTDATWSHTWYLYRILGIYLVMPLLSAFMCHVSRKEQVVLAGILLFLESLYPHVAGMIGFVPAAVSPVEGISLFYVLAGGILGGIDGNRLKKAGWGVAASALISGGMILGKGLQGNAYILKEDYPMSLFFAVCLFAGIKILCEGKASSHRIGSIARCSLGIYIVHPIFIHFLVKIVKWNPQYTAPVIMLPLMALVVLSASYLTVLTARHLAWVRKYIL